MRNNSSNQLTTSHELALFLLDDQFPNWRVADVRTEVVGNPDQKLSKFMTVDFELESRDALHCPCCGCKAEYYDSMPRRIWDSQPLGSTKTTIGASIPRIKCTNPECSAKISQINVPWAEPQVSLSNSFEDRLIDELSQPSSQKAVAERNDMTKRKVELVMKRAVKRGKKRKKLEPQKDIPEHIAIDEVALTGKEFFTVVTDGTTGTVLFVEEKRTANVLKKFYQQYSKEQLSRLKVISMDMWKPYIAATQEMVPDAEKKIVYDRFHIAAHLNDAVSEVRRAEHARLSKEGNTSLKNSRNIFRKSAANMTDKEIKRLNKYLEVSEITAEAWRVKDFNSSLWKYDDEPSAYNAWTAWIEEARKTGLKPMEKMVSMVENHLSGIVNAVVLGATNAIAESVNSKIKNIKRLSRGFRDGDRAKDAIFFHLGGLNMKHSQGLSSLAMFV